MRSGSRRRVGPAIAASLAMLCAGVVPARAQEAGTIAGAVVESATQRPIAGAQVYVPDTGLGTITNEAGRYVLLGVPAGEVTIRVEMLGYGVEERTVTVAAGQGAAADFELAQSAIALDEVVVTGAGVATERRKLGNTIGTINAQELEAAPVQSVSEMLAAREPGLILLPSSGSAGEGARIRIRGVASVSQSNEPIVYVDGIRVDNGGGFGPYVSAGGQASPSRLDDINPESIERIEVLKGAAAATLYGSEASSGVIQIFTKRGRQGPPRWTLDFEQGLLSAPMGRIQPLADFARDNDPSDPEAPTAAGQVARIREFWGIDVAPYEVFTVPALDRFFQTGLESSVTASVTGGSELITYFISGRYQHTDGPLAPENFLAGAELPVAEDLNTRRQLTVNLGVFPHERLRLRFNSFYGETTQKTPSNSNNIYGFWSSGLMGHPRLAHAHNPFGNLSFATVPETARERIEQEIQHYAGSLGITYQPMAAIDLDATFGVDIVNQRDSDFFPFGWNVQNFATFSTFGQRTVGDRNHRTLTADVKLAWDRPFGDFTSALLVGAQGFIEDQHSPGGFGDAFPGPGLEVVEAAGTDDAYEEFLRVVNAGTYVQEQLGFGDVAFLTLGARYDANSAFGENFEGAFYPKASLSLVPSDLGGWESSMFSTLRLRAAIGRSGLQPGAFDKFTTYAALGSTAGPGLAPGNLGNQDLKPEVTTEWEAGAELGLFEDRAAVDITYWDRTTVDALVPRQFPPSGGFRATQLDNIGELKASGVELSVNGNVLRGSSVSIELFAGAQYLEEEVVDMGGAPPLKVGGAYPRYRQFVKEGYAPGAFFGAAVRDVPIPLDFTKACIRGAEVAVPTREAALAYFAVPRSPDDFDVIAENCGVELLDSYLGKPTPDWAGSFGAGIDFLDHFTLRSLFEFKYGNYHVQDLSGAFRSSNTLIGRNTEEAARVIAAMLNPASSPEQRLDAAIYWARNLRSLAPMSGMNNIHPADFLRWRELALTYRVPAELAARFRLAEAAITLSGRNLMLWVNDAYTGMDPEVNIIGRCSGGGIDCNFLTSNEGWGVPLPRRFALNVRVGF